MWFLTRGGGRGWGHYWSSRYGNDVNLSQSISVALRLQSVFHELECVLCAGVGTAGALRSGKSLNEIDQKLCEINSRHFKSWQTFNLNVMLQLYEGTIGPEIVLISTYVFCVIASALDRDCIFKTYGAES